MGRSEPLNPGAAYSLPAGTSPTETSNHAPSNALPVLRATLRKQHAGVCRWGEGVTGGRVTARCQEASPAPKRWLDEGGVPCQNLLGCGGMLGSPPLSSLRLQTRAAQTLSQVFPTPVTLPLLCPSVHTHTQHIHPPTCTHLFLFCAYRSLERLPSPDPGAEGHGQSRQRDQDLITKT